MEFTNLRWADAAHKTMFATIDGGEVIVLNAMEGLAHYDTIIASGDPIAEYEPTLSADDEMMLNHENRLRTLEGQPRLTAVEFMKIRGA